MHARGPGSERRSDFRCRARLRPAWRGTRGGVPGTQRLPATAISDLLHQTTLLDAVEAAIADIVAAFRGPPTPAAGRRAATVTPAHSTTARWRSIAAASLGVVPKVHLPNYREFYEPRHFVAGDGMVDDEITIGAHTAPFGTDLLFAAEDVPNLVVHAEICEDIWIPIPPSSAQVAALAGVATVLGQPSSASNITIGKAETRRLLCASQSARCVAAYLYAAAGAAGESTTDLAWGRPGLHLRERRTHSRRRPCSFPHQGQPVRRLPTSTSTCCATSACRWAASIPTAGATPPPFAASLSAWIRRPATSVWNARRRALPIRARPMRHAFSRTATRGLQHPGLPWPSRSACAPPASSERRDRRFRRPGFRPRH